MKKKVSHHDEGQQGPVMVTTRKWQRGKGTLLLSRRPLEVNCSQQRRQLSGVVVWWLGNHFHGGGGTKQYIHIL